MKALNTSRLDRFSFALGAVGAVSSFAVMPVVADDRINAAWDQKLRSSESSPGAERRQGDNRLCFGT